MIDRSKVKKMWVWDEMCKNPKTKQRYVLDVCTDGKCVAVALDDEKLFLDGRAYRTVRWGYCEEIKEPSYRPFKTGEMPEEYLHYIYHRKYDGTIFKATAFNPQVPDGIYIGGSWRDFGGLFNNWEVKIDGEWKPVGVMEE